MIAGGLVVGRGRADVDILARAALEKANVAFHLFRHEANELADGVELHVAQQTLDFLFVADVGNDLLYACRHLLLAGATIEQPEVLSAGCQLSGDGTTDGACSTNNKYSHLVSLCLVDSPALSAAE